MRDEVTVEDKKLKEKTAHQSQVDFNKGFGGKFGVESDKQDKSAVGYDYHSKLSSHASQKGFFLANFSWYYFKNCF